MRALITGGVGRLGVTVCELLSKEGIQVRAFDLDNPRNRESAKELAGQVEIFWGDITKPDSVRKGLEGADIVVHMAAILPPLADDNPGLAEKVNVGGTKLVVDLIKEKGGHIPLIFTSSVTVFGPCPDAGGPLSVDSTVPHPKGTYPETKLKAENIIRESGIDYVILRLTAIMYFNHEISDIKRAFDVPLDTRVEFCHPDNLAIAILNAVKRFDAVKGDTLIISGGPGDRMLYKDMIGRIFGIMKLPLPPSEKFVTDAYCLDWYDTSKAQRLLNYQNKTFADYLVDYSKGLSKKYGAGFLPFMRRFVSPVLGKVVVRFM